MNCSILVFILIVEFVSIPQNIIFELLLHLPTMVVSLILLLHEVTARIVILLLFLLDLLLLTICFWCRVIFTGVFRIFNEKVYHVIILLCCSGSILITAVRVMTLVMAVFVFFVTHLLAIIVVEVEFEVFSLFHSE